MFSFLIGLGLISIFADRTHTGKQILLYEDAISLGGILFNAFFIYQIRIPAGEVFLGVLGLFSGIFVGCWAMALADILNVFPIFIRRLALVKAIPYLIIGLSLGKTAGALVYFLEDGAHKEESVERTYQQTAGEKTEKLRSLCKTKDAGPQCMEKHVPGICHRRNDLHHRTGDFQLCIQNGHGRRTGGMQYIGPPCPSQCPSDWIRAVPENRKVGGAGALVPITGFANSVAAPAIEYKKEGQVFGIGCKIFTIAGPVILYGIVTSWVLGLVYYLLWSAGISW